MVKVESVGTKGMPRASTPEEALGETRAEAVIPAMGAETPGPQAVEALERGGVGLGAQKVALGDTLEARAYKKGEPAMASPLTVM